MGVCGSKEGGNAAEPVEEKRADDYKTPPSPAPEAVAPAAAAAPSTTTSTAAVPPSSPLAGQSNVASPSKSNDAAQAKLKAVLPRLHAALTALDAAGQLNAGENALIGELARWKLTTSADIDGDVIVAKGGPKDSKGSLGLVA